MNLGIYISVPFCRTKCSYCNFASDVFSRIVFERYVDRVCADIAGSPQTASEMGGQLERHVDSIYLGGGTPTLLEAAQLQRIFDAVRSRFSVVPDAEVTVECAPGTLASGVIVAGLRIATVLSIGVATIAAAIGAGGLGEFIFRGLAMVNNQVILAGAVPAALLALFADFVLGRLERRLGSLRAKA